MKYRSKSLNLERIKVRSELGRVGIKPSRTRGQNFLTDPFVIEEIVAYGEPKPEEVVVEIGPGLGALTQHLTLAKELHLIEVESAFCERLAGKYPQVNIICSDVREVDFAQFGATCVVFGNLPYSFSTDILFHLINYREFIGRAILMFQREFADRIVADSGNRSYGVLSIMVQTYCEVRPGLVVSGDRFSPPTQVESRVIELRPRVERLVEEELSALFELVVRQSFKRRRKKLLNSISHGGLITKAQATEACQMCDIDSNRRPETLSVTEFISLTRAFQKILS